MGRSRGVLFSLILISCVAAHGADDRAVQVQNLKSIQVQLQAELQAKSTGLATAQKLEQTSQEQTTQLTEQQKILQDLHKATVLRGKDLLKKRPQMSPASFQIEATKLRAQLKYLRAEVLARKTKLQLLALLAKDRHNQIAKLASAIVLDQANLNQVNARLAKFGESLRSKESQEVIAKMDRAIASQSTTRTTYTAGNNVTLELRQKAK